MSRFSDTTQFHQTAVRVFSQQSVDPEVEIPAIVESSGLIARLAKFWTSRLERRHMRDSIARLGALSQHLLDDAGLTGAAQSNVQSDQDR